MSSQRFEWDADKRAKNLAKHGVDFSEAINVFADPYAVVEYSPTLTEERWTIVGLAFPRILLVVYTERHGDTLRIISARKALPHERHYYEAHRP
jgi:uncharacterized DUF497 family protein